jgi:Glycosyl hydrolase family 26
VPGKLGVYRGSANPGGVGEFAAWSGSDVRWALDFLASGTWSDIESPTWWTDGWAGSPYRTVYSIPLLPGTGGTLAQGASGAHNEHFAKLGRTLVAGGEADAILRLGWEFNGGWFRWSANGDPASFAAYWRQIVDTMRAVPGQRFQFDWSPVLGQGAVAPDRAYPGDAYVDYIGLDVYDQDWFPGWSDPAQRWQNLLTQPFGLRWHRDFAAAHGKPMTFPEWGLMTRADGHGGGDNPYFIERMHDWIASNNVAYALYFEFDAPDGAHRLMNGQFPRSAARFLQLFGAPLAAPQPPPPSPPPAVQLPPPATSPPVTPPPAAAPDNVSPPLLSGKPARGKTLKARLGTWRGSRFFSYRWERCRSSCSTIRGATGRSLRLGSADVGSRIRVVVTARNRAGSATATSAHSPRVKGRARR